MKQIVLLAILSGFTFLVFLILLVLALIKKNKNLRITSILFFLIFMILCGSTAFQVLNKSFNKVTEVLKPRNGDEIYNSLFGKKKTNCVTVLHYQDQIVPKIDYAIWLHFKTCPKELKRVLAQHKFDSGKIPTLKWNENIPYSENIKWFTPNKLGDTIIVYEYATNDSRNIQTIWSNLDSTEVFVRDIFD